MTPEERAALGLPPLEDDGTSPEQPGLLERWAGKNSFLGTAGDVAGRLGDVTGNLISAGGNLFMGDYDDAGRRVKSAAQALPGMVGGAADLVTGRFGLNTREYIDPAVGFDESDRMSTQKLMKESGLIQRDDNPLLSIPGAIGFIGDVAKDPTTYVTGGLTKAGQAASKVAGAKKYAAHLDDGIHGASQLGNTVRMSHLKELKSLAPEVPAGPTLAPTKSRQVEEGQRALVQFMGEPVIGGAGAYEAMDKVGEVASKIPGVSTLKNAFQHSPVEQTAATVDRTIRSTEAEFHQARQALNELRETPDQARRAELGDMLTEFWSRWMPDSKVSAEDFVRSADATFSPMAQNTDRAIIKAIEGKGEGPEVARQYIAGMREMFDEYRNIETRLTGNVGTGALQITAENKGLLSQFDADPTKVDEVIGLLNDNLLMRGTQVVNARGGLRQTLDQAHRMGVTVDELNDVLDKAGIKREANVLQRMGITDAPTGNNFFTENPNDVMYMRGAQHIRANGVQDYVTGLQKQGIASTSVNPMFKFERRLGDNMRGTTLFFPTKEVADKAENVLRLLVDPGESSKLLQLVDKGNNFMKAGVTRYFPEFHIRNTISNKIQSWLDGVPFTGEHRTLAADIMAGKAVGVKVGGKVLDRDTVLKLYASSGASRGGFWEAALSEAAPIGAKPGKYSKLTKGLESAASTIAGGGLIARNPKLLGKVTGNMIEDTDRLAHWLYKVQQGFDPMSAAKSVDNALFNYSKAAMTPFEQQVMNRVFLFYGYTRSVLPFMAQKALEQPGKVSTMLKLGTSGGRPENAPAYTDEQATIGLPDGWKGVLGGKPRQDAIGISLPTPLGAAVEPIADMDKGIGGFLAGLGSKTTPFLKGPVESATKIDTFTRRPITNEPPEILKKMGVDGVPPDVNVLLKNLPTSRGMRSAGEPFSPDLLSKLAGFSTKKFDDKAQGFFNVQAELQDQIDGYYNKGWVRKTGNKYYVNKDVSGIPKQVYAVVEKYNRAGMTGAKIKKANGPQQPSQ